ncbi:hypothetical protein GCM10023339_04300 [Alloalcanivorax gelatiniphagus]
MNRARARCPGLPHGRNLYSRSTRGRRDEENDMFNTDSFLGAEIAYRQDRIRKDYGVRRWTRVRVDDTKK